MSPSTPSPRAPKDAAGAPAPGPGGAAGALTGPGKESRARLSEGWREAREAIREDVEREGYDERRGVFRMAYGYDDHDAALLRLPAAGFLAWDDERMVRTADALREALDLGGGLLRRYDADDGMAAEGAFLPCSFWLATLLARQGRGEEAREAFERTAATANDLGLFAEEYDPAAERMLGNFPQALTHLSHIEAAQALSSSASGIGLRFIHLDD